MAKKVGYEVTGTKPVCVDFPDGRAVSFRPGMRFEAHPTNSSVRRLLRVREVRALGPMERVPTLPVKLGAPKKVRDILESRGRLAQARKLAQLRAKKAKSKPNAPEFINLGAMNRPRPTSDASGDDN